MAPGTGNLIAGVLAVGFGFIALIWLIATLADGENPLSILADIFPSSDRESSIEWVIPDRPKQSKPEVRRTGQVYDEHREPSDDPYSEEALEEAKCKKQLAINYYYYFAGKEKLIERAMKAKSENRGRRR